MHRSPRSDHRRSDRHGHGQAPRERQGHHGRHHDPILPLDPDRPGPQRIPRDAHPISRKNIDPDSLRVLYKLKDAGFQAYLVGGAVRDLLMGRKPKDFDIATDARPNDLRHLFRNSRIVGRRFRIVHVFFGPKNVEVSTLRSAVEPPDPEGDLYIDDDNQWGDLESDAFRRDFSINALYYDLRDFSILDHTGGVADIGERLIRAIGDPGVRFREDPVRMLRALKFAARFSFDLEHATARAIEANASEIHKASRFRVTEEIFRILTQDHREAGFRLLLQSGLLYELYPGWCVALGETGLERVAAFFAEVDRAAAEGLYYPLEILAAGLFVPLLDRIDPAKSQFNAVAARITRDVRTLGVAMELPKRLLNHVVELLRGQLYLRFFSHLGKRVRRFVESPWFDPAWHLHQLAFGHLAELEPVRAIWWEARSRIDRPLSGTADGPDRRDIFSFRGKTGGGRHPGGRGQGNGRGDSDEDDGEFAEPEVTDEDLVEATAQDVTAQATLDDGTAPANDNVPF